MIAGEPYRELLILTNGKARSVPSSSDGVFGPDPGNAASRPDGSLSPRSPRSPPKLAPTQLKEMDAVIEYVEGSFFGELEFLGISSARSMTVRAQRFCEVSTLNPLDIQDVLDIHIGLKVSFSSHFQHVSRMSSHVFIAFSLAAAVATVWCAEARHAVSRRAAQRERERERERERCPHQCIRRAIVLTGLLLLRGFTGI